MKSTGIVRRVDQLGRVVLPMELRRILNIGIKDSLEIFVEEEKIILRKYEPACVFCKTADNVIEHGGRLVCEECIRELCREIS